MLQRQQRDLFLLPFRNFSLQGFYFYFFRIRHPKRQIIAVVHQLQQISHASQLDQSNSASWKHPQFQKMLPQRAFAPYRQDARRLPWCQIL